MLMYGKASVYRTVDFVGSGIAYNLTSYSEGFYQLLNILPPNNLPRSTERDFDIQYANYIMNNDLPFIEFFSIIYNLYLGIDVYLVVDDDQNWAENILQSLLKLIQQRYGYNGVYIDSDEDYIWCRNYGVGKFDPGYGLYNLDQDKERFTYILENIKIKGGSIPPGVLWGNNEQ